MVSKLPNIRLRTSPAALLDPSSTDTDTLGFFDLNYSIANPVMGDALFAIGYDILQPVVGI